MDGCKTVLRADPTDWLLEEENPSVRYYALKDILDKPEDDAQVQSARRAIMQTGIVPDILKKQLDPAYAKTHPEFYTSKYKGLVWQLIVLAELGADADAQIKEQCEYILANSQERTGGGFAMHASAKTGGGRITEVIPCLCANMVWSLIRFGYLDDPRLQRGIDWLTQHMRFNDGVETDPQVAPYNRYEPCWGRHTCHMGVVKALKALGGIPRKHRNEQVNDTIEKSVEFLLIHHIHKRSHDLGRVSKPGWLKFGFPLMYQTDVLEVLDILTGLGIRDSRMDEAVNLVLSKQDDTGRWKLENAYANERMLIPIETKNAPSKWITLRAVRVLKRWGQ